MTSRKKISRRKEYFQLDEKIPEQSDLTANAEDQLISRSIELAIQEILNGLDQKDQETIKIAIHEMHRPDIPPATFRKRLERAMVRLKDAWRDQYE